ncbi:unnamed protein product [Haemonchus placei]|uniref:C2H2-type domain-containing protein n=1 Tax=Haemonchus placei TaxID=6290 RepID=A0A158QR13_HAEPC|nr:unnamed protein product [Haemonchus placei]
MAELLWRCDLCSDLVLHRMISKHLQEGHNFPDGEAQQVETDIAIETASNSSGPVNSLVTCPSCGVEVLDHVGLARHCEHRHREDSSYSEPQDYSVFTAHFSTFQKYEEWLVEECDRTCTRFIDHTKYGGALFHLRCNRGDDDPCEKQRTICSCFLNVRISGIGPIIVHGCFGHIGHKVDVSLRSLTFDEELFLKTLLEEYSMDHVLALLKRDFSLKASRLAQVTREDLCDILKKYQLIPISCEPMEGSEACIEESKFLHETVVDEESQYCSLELDVPDEELREPENNGSERSNNLSSTSQQTAAFIGGWEQQNSSDMIDNEFFDDTRGTSMTESLSPEEKQFSKGHSVKPETNDSTEDENSKPSRSQVDETTSACAESERIMMAFLSNRKRWRCYLCSRVMVRRFIQTHLIGIHKLTQEQLEQVLLDLARGEIEEIQKAKRTTMRCPVCEEKVKNHFALAVHCDKFHRDSGADGQPQDYTVFKKSFGSNAVFEEWLSELCERTTTSLIRRNVKGCHTVDVTLLRLNQTQVLLLKRLLEEYSVNHIIRLLKEQYPTKTSRLAHVTLKDLQNVAKRYGLKVTEYDECCNEPNDELPVDQAEDKILRGGHVSQQRKVGNCKAGDLVSDGSQNSAVVRERTSLNVTLLEGAERLAIVIEIRGQWERDSQLDRSRKRFICCPVCGEATSDPLSLAKHCDKVHKSDGAEGEPQDYTIQNVTCDTYTEFEKWLTEQCDRTCTTFLRRSSRPLPGGGTSHTLRCHRAVSSAGSGLRRLRPSKKPNEMCSCYLNVRVDKNGVVTAQGCFGHVGHKVEVTLFRLSNEQEMFLKGLLEVHSIDFVLDQLKQDFPSKNSRLYHITRDELRNILHRHKITPVPHESHYGGLSLVNEENNSQSDCNVTTNRSNELCHTNKSTASEGSEDSKDLQGEVPVMHCITSDMQTVETDALLFSDDKPEIFPEIMDSSCSQEESLSQNLSNLPVKGDAIDSLSELPEHQSSATSSSSTSHSSIEFQEKGEQIPQKELWRCDICSKTMLLKNLYIHLRRVHAYTRESVNEVRAYVVREERRANRFPEAPRMYCPICGVVVFDHVVLAKHCATFHSNDGAGGDPQDYTVFTKCSRAGRYVCGATKRLKPTKKQTKNCSCFLNVRVDECGTVSVIGCFGHVGHKVDAALIRLTNKQEMFLKNLLEVYPIGDILLHLKKDYPAKTSRLHHVSRAELKNLMKKYQLKPVPYDNVERQIYRMNGENYSSTETVEEQTSEASPVSKAYTFERNPQASFYTVSIAEKELVQGPVMRVSCHDRDRDKMVSSSADLWRCTLCRKALVRKRLYAHLQNVHNFTKEEVEMVKRDVALEANSTRENNQKWKVSCPECDEKLPDHLNLAVHCDRFHKDYKGCGQSQDYRVFTTTFNSYAEFQIWLSSESERTCTSLFRRSTSLKGNTFTLRCHRAGRYKPKQRVRTHASKKQTKNCSCYLNVRIDDDGVVSVEGCFGHIGHKLEVSLLRLSAMQELFLKDLLEKYSMDSILQRLQLEYSSKTSRLGFVDRKDLWNIAYRYHITPVPNDGGCPEHSTCEQNRSTSTVVEERDCDTSTSFAEHSSEHHETDTEDSRSSTMSEASEHFSEKDDDSSLHEKHQEAVGSSGGSAPTKLVPMTGTTLSQKASASTTTANNRSEAPSVTNRLCGAPPLSSMSRRIVVPSKRLEPPHSISLADGQRSHGQGSSYLPSVGTVAQPRRQEKLCPPRIADEYHPELTPLPPPSRFTTVSLSRLEPPHSISLTDEHRPVPNASSLPLQRRVVPITRQSDSDRTRIEEEHHYCMKSLPSTSQSTIRLPVKQGQRNPVKGPPQRHITIDTEGMFSELGGKQNNVDLRGEPQIEDSEKTEPSPQKKVPPREELWRCKLCKRVMLRKSLYIHLQKVHNFNKEQLESVKRDIAQEMASYDEQGNARVTCPICGEKLLNHAGLAAHCERDHQNDGAEGEPQDYRLFTVTFNSRDEFELFGVIVSDMTTCVIHSKAAMTRDAGLVTALGCFGHAGHKIDVALLRLTSSQEQFLRGLLEVYSMDSILDQLKMDYSPKTSKLYHVTRCDLWNIVNKYNIPTPLKGSRKKRQGTAVDKKTSAKKVRNNEITEPREITYTCL